MKFGVREICDVVLKAKAAQKVGNKVFYKNEPVIYFDTLKTSSMEGAATTVYAQGGRGNSRLVAWEGERTITFTMEDALISPAGFMILSGAGLTEASKNHTLKVHKTEQTDKVVFNTATGEVEIILSEKPYLGQVNAAGDFIGGTHEDLMYVMKLENGEVATEPYIPDHERMTPVVLEDGVYRDATEGEKADGYRIYLLVGKKENANDDDYVLNDDGSQAWEQRPTRMVGYDEFYARNAEGEYDTGKPLFRNGDIVLVDYYVEKNSGAQQIEITPDKFGGNYYLEASTLFRDTNGVDMPAEFIIPNCKIQSNFTFTMASSGDPSTFTFTMDAFPDYTRFDKTKKVLAAIQIIDAANAEELQYRTQTSHDIEHEKFFI